MRILRVRLDGFGALRGEFALAAKLVAMFPVSIHEARPAAETAMAAGEGEENAEFKQSPSVRFLAKITVLSLRSASWLAIALNFAVIA